MKVYKPIGSKERFLEMFQGVNKMSLNEGIGESGNVANDAFDELANGRLNIEQTNTQSSNGENHVEIVGSDDAGNTATFKFVVTTSPEDQEGVTSVDSAKLISLGIRGTDYNMELPEGVQAITVLNQERGAEMIDLVSAFVDSGDGAPEIDETDEIYEEAVKFIDKVPYKKGTEQIQTNKAYADQKPTNDKLRVSSDQLDKFVSEVVGDLEDDMLPPDFKMPNISTTDDGTKGIDPMDEPIDFDDSEPVEAVSPEKAAVINQAYDNLVAAGNQAPTVDDILREVDKIKGVDKSVEKTRAIPKGAEEFYEGTSAVGDMNADDVLTHGFNQLLPDDHKKAIIQMADEILSNKLGVKKFQMPKEQYVQMVKGLALEIYHRGAAHMNEGWETTTNDAGEPTGQDYRYDANDPEYHEQDDDRNQPDFNTGEWGADRIKWKEVYDAILQNSQAYDAEQKPNPQHADGVLTDPEYGVISSPELEKLTHASYKTKWGIYDDEGQPYFDADSVDYPTFEEFVPVVTDILNNPKKYFSSPAIHNPTGANFPSDMYEGEDEKTYPDPIGKKFKPKRQFPKKKKKITTDVKLSEGEEEEGPETGQAPDFKDMPEPTEMPDGEDGNQIPGGKADEKDPVDFNPQQIMIGIGVEMEHTDDPKLALEIAMDHLMEIPDYYTRLDKMEKEASVGDETDVEGKGMGAIEPVADEDSETTDELLGFKPHNVGDYVSEEDLNDYQGEIGDRYQDGKGNQLTVKDTDDNNDAVTLQSQDGDTDIATQDIKYLKPLEEEAGGKYSTVEKTRYGMTYLFAFPDPQGIETEEGLNGWERQDPANRELYFVDNREAAVGGLESFQETVDEMFDINEVEKARRTLNKRGLNEGMSKKEAVQILIKHNIR